MSFVEYPRKRTCQIFFWDGPSWWYRKMDSQISLSEVKLSLQTPETFEGTSPWIWRSCRRASALRFESRWNKMSTNFRSIRRLRLVPIFFDFRRTLCIWFRLVRKKQTILSLESMHAAQLDCGKYNQLPIVVRYCYRYHCTKTKHKNRSKLSRSY